MPLALGNRLGNCEILAFIDAGGMGEVYRARDTKLKRDVAVKVLPEAFAADPGRIALPARGRSAGFAQSPQYRSDLRRRRPGAGHGTGRGRIAQRPDAVRGRLEDRDADRRRAGIWRLLPSLSPVLPTYDVAPDGKRFAVVLYEDGTAQEPITHVTFLLNFFDELRRKVPVNKMRLAAGIKLGLYQIIAPIRRRSRHAPRMRV